MGVPGYHSRVLEVDVATGARSVIEPGDDVLRRFLGGSGLATWVLNHHATSKWEALSPEAPLVFSFSPLVGSPVTTSAKFAVVAKSPLTNRLNDSLASSQFAIAGKRTGFDAIKIVGRAAVLSALVIDGGEVRVQPCPELACSSSEDAQTKLQTELGPGYRLAAIGVAGERMVKYATLSHDGRHAGRGGLGAVMGSKNLKAIAVRGEHRVRFAHPKQLIAKSRDLSARSRGEATAKYRELGTVGNLLTFNRLATLPTRNFQQSSFDKAGDLAALTNSRPAEAATFAPIRDSCAACTIGCEHIFRTDDGKETRLEYENLYALGPLCGVSDPRAVLEASRLCDEFGLDTISTGASLAFFMECAERGLIETDLRFGNAQALIETIPLIANRRGIGDLLAEGTRCAAMEIGGGSDTFAPHVKGLEIPGYEPRMLQTMALGFAVNARGADHNRSGAYQVDFSEDHDRRIPDSAAVAAAIETENEAALFDSLILCKFLRHVLGDSPSARLPEMAELLSLVTGWEITTEELTAAAEHIVAEKKRFNICHGWTPAEDTLPARFFDQPLPGGEQLSRERLASLIRQYNELRGWTPEGWLAALSE